MSALVINHVKICRTSSFITMQNLVVISCTVCVPVGGTVPKLWMLGPHHLGWVWLMP